MLRQESDGEWCLFQNEMRSVEVHLSYVILCSDVSSELAYLGSDYRAIPTHVWGNSGMLY